jgi:hypothetical protein
MQYVRLCKTLVDKGILIPENALNDNINDHTKDWYSSVFFYNQQEFDVFKKTGTIAGITGLTSNKLIFDFDSQDDLEAARSDTLDICNKLITNGITEDLFNICFSGNKGFSIELRLNKQYSSKELKGIAKALAGDKTSFDTKVYNDSRIFRIPYTRHNITGLYKTPISLATLSEASIEDIKANAVDNNGIDWKDVVVELPESLQVKLDKKINLDTFEVVTSFERKMKFIPACREAILSGMFPNGHRSHALMALTASLKSAGIIKEIAVRMVKGAAELQAKRYACDPFPEEEIENNIIKVVYGPNWQGATYSCKDGNHEWLTNICKTTGKYSCALKATKDEFTSFDKLAGKFKDFAVNIEKNRIYTGIKEIDDKIMLTTSMPVGLLGAPGSGKTSVVLDILNSTSNAGVKSMFCSFDMGWNLVYSKLVSRVSGLAVQDVLETYKLGLEDYKEYDAIISDQFKNVIVSFDSSKTLDEIRETILAENERSPEKVKLVVIDYLECLAGPFSDATANGAWLANKIKNLATELELCVIVLVQPPKSAGDASQPLYSMRQVKGASTLEQNFRAILGVYREGFSPSNPEQDRFMTVACLKNTLGGLFTVDLHWEGLRGHVRALEQNEREDLAYLRETLKETKSSNSNGWD